MHFITVNQQLAATMLSCRVLLETALSVKLPIVSLRFIQRNSKALNCDAFKLHRALLSSTCSPKVRCLGTKSPSMCIFSRVNVCFLAGLPRSLYIQCECVFPCRTPTELVCLLVLMLDPHRAFISSCVNVCFHAGLPRSLSIQCECVFPCWTPTELVYLVVLGLMLDSRIAFISSCG